MGGVQCSCIKPTSDINSSISMLPTFRPPALLVNNNIVVPNALAAMGNHSNLGNDSSMQTQEDHTLKKAYQGAEVWAKLKTNDAERTRDDSNELLKKCTSFFRFSSLDSRYQADPTEYANDQNKSDWKLQNINLEKIIHMARGEGKYMWEAYNVATQKRCIVKITLFEKSKLTNNNYLRTERILRCMAEMENPNVTNIYSFSLFETEFQSKLYLAVVIVQESVKCSLKDVDTLLVKRKHPWSQNQLLVIIRDVFNGLVAIKERQLYHGRLMLENILVSENKERVLIADVDLQLPLVNFDRTASSRVSILKGDHSFLNPEPTEKVLIMPDEKDISDLTAMVKKMLDNDENQGVLPRSLRRDDDFKETYRKVFEALDLINNKKKSVVQIMNELESLTKKGVEKLHFDVQYNFESKHQKQNQIDLMFLKLDCYELLKQHNTALEVCWGLMEIYEKKENKNIQEYQEYIKCVNCVVKYYLYMKDWLKARDISEDLSNLIKKDELFRNALKGNRKEYINFTFLLGNISEGLGEFDKAILFYAKGLAYCDNQHIGLDTYPPTLKRISNLYLQKNEHTKALDCLKKLVNYYEKQDGYFVDRVDGYLNMGDIHIKQGNLGQGVKHYLKGLENFKKGKLNSNEAMLNIVDKIVNNYKLLHEDENALRYMVDSLELKRKIFGRDSVEHMDEIKEIAAAHVRLQNYGAALNHLAIYQKIAMSDAEKRNQYLESLLLLGDIYSELKMYDKARNSFETYANLEKETHGIESKEYLLSQDKLASIYFKEGKVVKSVKVQLEVLPIKEKLLKPDDLYLVVSLNNIGDTFYANNDYTRALKYHRQSINKLKDRQKEFKEECSQLFLRIALDYHKCGESGKALKSVHHSFQISRKDGFEPTMGQVVEMFELVSKTSEIMQKGLDFSRLTEQIKF